jgi:hypothetical protein
MFGEKLGSTHLVRGLSFYIWGIQYLPSNKLRRRWGRRRRLRERWRRRRGCLPWVRGAKEQAGRSLSSRCRGWCHLPSRRRGSSYYPRRRPVRTRARNRAVEPHVVEAICFELELGRRHPGDGRHLLFRWRRRRGSCFLCRWVKEFLSGLDAAHRIRGSSPRHHIHDLPRLHLPAPHTRLQESD